MRFLHITILFILVGCATNQVPTYQAENIDEYIEQYQAQSNQSIISNTLHTYSFAGIGMFVAGVGVLAFTSRIKSGMYMIAGGGALMSAVWIFNSEWFDWIVGGLALIVAIDASYILYIKSKEWLSGKKTGQNENHS